MGSILVKKVLRGGFPFHKNCEKIEKSAVFEAGKPSEMGLDLQKFQKKLSNQLFFE